MLAALRVCSFSSPSSFKRPEYTFCSRLRAFSRCPSAPYEIARFTYATDFTPFLNLDWEAWPGNPYYYDDDDDDDDAGAHDEHTSNPSTLKVHFMWGIHRDMMAFTSHYDEERAMSLADVRSMLEHYLDWA